MRCIHDRGGSSARVPGRNLALFLAVLVFSAGSSAGDWTVVPRITLAEIFTDNLTLVPSDPQSDAVTQIQPGVKVQGRSNRSLVDLDYSFESLLYAKDSARNNVYQNLRASAQEQLVKEKVALGATATIGQVIISPEDFVLTDNITPGNRSNVVSYSLTPEVRDTIGGVVDADARYRYGHVNYLDTDAASDSTLHDVNVGLKSAHSSSRVSWGAVYSNSVTDRVDAPDTLLESSQVTVRLGLSSHWSFYAVSGRENNDVTWAKSIENGSYWRAGLSWTPVSQSSVQASYGDLSKEASLNWSPTARTSLRLAYLNQAVGVNPGPTWSGEFRHRTRHTTWQAGYVDEVTNVQTLQNVGEQNVAFIDPDTGIPSSGTPSGFTLTNEDFIRKRSYAGVAVNTALTVAGVNLFYETREYQISGTAETDRGADASFDWRMASRTRLVAIVKWLVQDYADVSVSGTDRSYNAALGLERSLGSKLFGTLKYGRAARNSATPQRNYVENRITVELDKLF